MVDSHLQSGILTWQSMEIDCQPQVAIQGTAFFCTCGLASFLQPARSLQDGTLLQENILFWLDYATLQNNTA